MSDRLKDLTFKYFMGTLLPEERTALLQLLQDPAQQDRFVRESTMFSVLHEWATEELQEESRIPSPSTRRRRAVPPSRPVWPWGLAAAALFLAAIWFATGPSPDPAPADRSVRKVEPRKEPVERREPERPKIAPPSVPAKDDAQRKARIDEELRKSIAPAPRTPDPIPAPAPDPTPAPKPAPEPPLPTPRTTTVAVATLERIDGEAWILAGLEKVPAKSGQDLLAGQGLETRGDAVVRFPDKTRLEVGPGTVLREIKTAEGKRVVLEKGDVRAEVAKQPKDQPMIFATPHAEAKVVGTILRLVVDKDTRLEVEEGKVQLKNLAGKLVLVETGHYAVAAPSAELAAKLLPVTVVFTKAEDTTIYGWPSYEDQNYGAWDGIRVSAGPQGFTGLLRFPNLVGVKPGLILPKSRVVSAILRLKMPKGMADVAVPFKFYRCLKPWGEGRGAESFAQRGEATHKAAQHGSLPWEAPGATGRTDRAGELIPPEAVIDKAGFVTFDVTPLVQAWVNGELNFGFIIVGQLGGEFMVSSSDDKTAANRPQLTVVFSN